MFRQKLKGGHRVGLQAASNPTVQNDINSSQVSTFQENSWNWDTSNIEYSDSTPEYQNSVSSDITTHHNQQSSQVYNYAPAEIYNTNTVNKQITENNREQKVSTGWSNQNKDDWNWDEWETAGGIQSVHQTSSSHISQLDNFSIPKVSQEHFPIQTTTPEIFSTSATTEEELSYNRTTKENFSIPTESEDHFVTKSGTKEDYFTTEPSTSNHFPTQMAISTEHYPSQTISSTVVTSTNIQEVNSVHDCVFDKVDVTAYRDNIENIQGFEKDNDKIHNLIGSDYGNNPVIDSISSYQDFTKPQSNEQNLDNKIYHEEQPAFPSINGGDTITYTTDSHNNNEIQWENDNWDYNEPVSNEKVAYDMPIENSLTAELETKVSTFMEQNTNTVMKQDNSGNVPKYPYSEIKNDLIESPALWENDNWSSNEFSSDNGTNGKLLQVDNEETFVDKSEKDFNSNQEFETVQQSEGNEHSSNNYFIEEMSSIPETFGMQSLPETLGKKSLPESLSKQSLPESPSKQFLPDTTGMQSMPESLSKQSLPDTTGMQSLPETVDKQFNVGTVEKTTSDVNYHQQINTIEEQLDPPILPTTNKMPHRTMSSEENLIAMPTTQPEEQSKTVEFDKMNQVHVDNVLDVKRRGEILSHYMENISRSRTVSLSDSIKDEKINSLDEELHGIFSTPTNLVNYPTPDEYRIRTGSLTRISKTIPAESNADKIEVKTEENEKHWHLKDKQQFVTEDKALGNTNPVSSLYFAPTAVPDESSTIPVESIKNTENTNARSNLSYPLVQTSFPSTVCDNPSLIPRKGSPFQPPQPKRTMGTMKSSSDNFQFNTDKKINSDYIVEPIVPKKDTSFKKEKYNSEKSEGMVVCRQNRENNSRSETNGASAINAAANNSTLSASSNVSIPLVVKVERCSPPEENFTRMIPGESSKGKRGPIAHPAPPAMPTGRFVTGDDDPQTLPTIRIKQEANAVRSPPDGPDILSPINHDSSVVPPVRSETIGSEEPSGVSKSRNDKKPDSMRDRGYDSSSGEYYPDRYAEKNHQNRYYYREEPTNGRPSYERDYDSKYRRPKYESDDEENDHYGESRSRHRSYRQDVRNYTPNVKEEFGYHRKRDRPRKREQQRGYRLSTADDDPFYPKSDRSRPSSRSSSPKNLEGVEPSAHPNAMYKDRHYERQHRRPSKRDYQDDRSIDRMNSRDPYQRGYGGQYPEQYGSRAMYEQNYYYYYQKYMEQNPYYRDFYRQYYARNYGYPGSSEGFPGDKSSSIRSGRSSVNDELKKSMSSGEASATQSVTDDNLTQKPNRLTPHHFGAAHFISKFTPGGKLVVVLPNDPNHGEKATVIIKDVQQLLSVDKVYSKRIQQMKNYAGPIAYNDIHKDVVIAFCNSKISEASSSNELVDKQSVILLWEYLLLLVKLNGKVCGADLASLLLEQKNKTESLAQSAEEDSAVVSDEYKKVPSNVNIKPFTEYLCLGRRKEAIEYAIQHELWGHAMMLATKMDPGTHARVMTAFLNSIPTSDVLQTAVQHMSGKRPDVTKNFNPDRWGDWREHLAVLVSNSTGNGQRDKGSIVGLGDTLASRGQLHAAHICYLAGEVEWGTFNDKSSKIVLLGSSHNQSFQAFTTEEAFQCTEIFEYAKSLDNTNEIFHTFQSYKLVYALRLAECGFFSECLSYCEVMSNVVCKHPQYYQEEFVARVLDLASRLKFYDPHYEMGGELADIPDPEWLQQLSNVVYMMQMQNIETNTSSLTGNVTQPVNDCVTDSKEPIKQEVQQSFDGTIPQVGTQLDQDNGYGSPVYENNYKQTPTNTKNYELQNNYSKSNLPPLDIGYARKADTIPPFEQSPPVQHQETHLPWQPIADTSPTVHSQSPPIDTYQQSSEEADYWAMMSNKPSNNQQKSVEKPEIKSKIKEEDMDAGRDADEKKGFFGSLFGWKKSNQAKLPDDSNPSIVWDEDKKKWVNKDGEEETENPPPPPPSIIAAPPPITGSFRGGGRVSRYVDPVGEKRRQSGPSVMPAPAVAPSITPNGALPAMSPAPTYMSPPAVIPAQGAGTEMQSPPLESIPNRQMERIRYISESSSVDLEDNLQVADGDSASNLVPMMGAPPMFNPNQYTASTVPSSGSLPRKTGPVRRSFGKR